MKHVSEQKLISIMADQGKQKKRVKIDGLDMEETCNVMKGGKGSVNMI